jgi:D-alanine transfer protein
MAGGGACHIVKLTHRLLAALLAALVIAAVLVGGVLYARSVESRYVHALAPQLERISLIGSALQRVALRQPDLLPVYGSSEVALGVDGYTAPEVFRTYPTGFAPFEVAHVGVTSLTMAETIAALGPDLRGQKVIISVAPTMFFSDKVATDGYRGLFSRLHADELIFSTQLGLDVKQAAARRMLVFPTTLDKEPVLRFALKRLAGGSPLDLALYYAVWPLGKLWTTVLELQDHWEVLAFIWSNPQLNPEVPHVPAAIDWAALKARAEQEQMANADNNPYGIDNELWQGQEHTTRAPGSIDPIALKRLRGSPEWADFDILLRVLTAMGARPLILSRPVNLVYWESMGISSAVSQAYYDRLHDYAARYGLPVVDFQAYSEDKYFSVDSFSHTSRKGWVYVNEVMDDFYHDRLP